MQKRKTSMDKKKRRYREKRRRRAHRRVHGNLFRYRKEHTSQETSKSNVSNENPGWEVEKKKKKIKKIKEKKSEVSAFCIRNLIFEEDTHAAMSVIDKVDIHEKAIEQYETETPLEAAVYMLQVEVVKKMLQSNTLNLDKEKKLLYLLFNREELWELDCVEMRQIYDMLKDKKYPYDQGLHFLAAACKYGCVELVELLLQDPNVDVNKKCRDGSTAMDVINRVLRGQITPGRRDGCIEIKNMLN